MIERQRLVAGNWKMNGLRAPGVLLARALAERARNPCPCELLICPPTTLLTTVGEVLSGSGIALGGQDCHADAQGASTGDVSAEMLKDCGCTHVIVGHSERRHGHCESNEAVCAKVAAAWRAGLAAILCVGETRGEREAGRAEEIVVGQLEGSLPNGALDPNGAPDNGGGAARLVVAYEPVWAIGSGLTPTAHDIARMHAAIRRRLPDGTRILYGGSVNPKNAAEILALDEVDGALVGGASLKAEDFWAIAEAC